MLLIHLMALKNSVVVYPDSDSITIPPELILQFNPEVYPIDFITNPTTVPTFDPNNTVDGTRWNPNKYH